MPLDARRNNFARETKRRGKTVMPGTAVIINDEIFSELRGLRDGTLLPQLIDSFCLDYPARIAAAQAGLERGDHRAIQHAAHAMRGAAANFGASQVNEIAEEIEQRAEEKNSVGLFELLIKLNAAHVRLVERLEIEKKLLLKAKTQTGRRRIAVVEDDPVNQLLIRSLMEPKFDLTAYDSGAAAAAGIGREKPDLVLLDIGLPDMSGTDVLHAIRAEIGLGNTPIIALTAYAMAGDRETALSNGFDEYLTKPINEDALHEAVDRLLNNGRGTNGAKHPSVASPLQPKNPPTITAPAELESEPTRRHIAVVEDHPVNQLLIRSLMEPKYNLSLYDTGTTAIAGILKEKPDLVLLDIGLPDMYGTDVLRAIRADHNLRRIPVIALTAHAMAGDREVALSEGFDEYLTKPIDEDALNEAVRRLLKNGRNGMTADGVKAQKAATLQANVSPEPVYKSRLRSRIRRYLPAALAVVLGLMMTASSVHGAWGAIIFGSILTLTIAAYLFSMARYVERIEGIVAKRSTALSREMAERRLVERAAISASEAKTRFFAVISHELRTPLNSIIGFARILEREIGNSLDIKHRFQIKLIVKCSHQLLGLIDQILDLSRIEAGRVELHISTISLVDCVRDVVSQFEPQAREKSLFLKLDVPDGHISPIETDSARFQQVLVNLLGNAMKFTEKGGVTVRIHSEAVHYTTVEIIDTGPGIPRKQLEMIFEPFKQADASISHRYGGTGLGLAISRSICRLLGFRLEVDSRVGHGTTFRINLAPST